MLSRARNFRPTSFAVAFALGAYCLSATPTPSSAAGQGSELEIRRLLIQRSLTNYPGNCPCPYNLMRNGAPCAGRSAYSRPGGYRPYCYPQDVPKDEINAYRKNGGATGRR